MIEVYSLMEQVNAWVRDILKDNYVGVYFHGSLRLGSFNPQKSDLDFIIVAKAKLDFEAKELIWDKMLDNMDEFPGNGFEFSVVLLENCIHIRPPVAYELHGSQAWIDRYKADKKAVINEDYKVDPDLVSHFHVINVSNHRMDFGRPSEEVFERVPREYVIDSNYQDTLECVRDIESHPVYCVLNLCRFYALVRNGLTLSKHDGGLWALKHMNSNYNDVIRLAVEDYGSDNNHVYDAERLKAFAQEAITCIHDCMDYS